MAQVKFGAIITDIRGSINGFTFRKQKNTNVLYAKQRTQNRSFDNKNNVALANAFYFSKWNSLTTSLKNDWNYAATLFAFGDKFGGEKYLSGRQLFVKLNTQKQNFPNVISLGGINSTVETCIVTVVVIKKSPANCNIAFATDMLIDKVYVSAKQVTQGTDAIVNKQLLTISKSLAPNDVNLQISLEFFTAFPSAQVGDRFQLTCHTINDYGFKSAPSSFIVTIT